MRWSKKVEEGVQLIYSFMSTEAEAGEWSAIKCRASDVEVDEDGGVSTSGRCGECEECGNMECLEAGLAWLGAQIDKHPGRPRRRKAAPATEAEPPAG